MTIASYLLTIEKLYIYIYIYIYINNKIKQFNNSFEIKQLLQLSVKYFVKDQREKQFYSPTSFRKAYKDVLIRDNLSLICT